MEFRKGWLDWTFYALLFLLVLITLIDLAMVGEHQQFYKWVLSDSQRDFVDKNYKNYKNSMNGIMVLSCFYLLFLPFFVYSAFNVQKKWHLVYQGFNFVLFFFGLWIALIVFLTGFKVYRESLADQWNDTYKGHDDLCNSSSDTLIACAYSWSFVNARRAATAHIIFLSLFGPFIIFYLYRVNGDQESSASNGNDLGGSQGSTQNQKYKDNEQGHANDAGVQ